MRELLGWQRGRVVSASDSRSWVRVPLWPLAGFVRGRLEFKSLARLVNSQLVASCYIVFELFVSKNLSGVPVI